MALTKCPECNKEISDKANTCPSCGYPMKAHAIDTKSKNLQEDESDSYSKEVQTIEATGKETKSMLIKGFLLAVVGVVIFAGGSSSGSDAGTLIGAVILIWGCALLIISKASAWWHHG